MDGGRSWMGLERWISRSAEGQPWAKDGGGVE